jgi:hypothetical protein
VDKSIQWITLFTNLGVIAGLALLVYEINQNTQALYNDRDVAIYSMSADNSRLLVESPELRGALEKANTGEWSGFSYAERLILWGFWGNEVDRLELQFRLFQRDGVEPDNILFGESDLKLESFRSWWGEAKVL